MTLLTHKSGDIFTSDARAIGHGINVKGAMAHGIALQFKNRFPDMHAEYIRQCNRNLIKPGEAWVWQEDGGMAIFNIASQEYPGANAQYGFLARGVLDALRQAESMGIYRLALPRIGSGVGGLDQQAVENILWVLAVAQPVDIELWTFSA